MKFLSGKVKYNLFFFIAISTFVFYKYFIILNSHIIVALNQILMRTYSINIKTVHLIGHFLGQNVFFLIRDNDNNNFFVN